MAKPIKDTPILRGKDAVRFSKEIKENETRKVSKSEYERVMANYRKVRGMIKLG